DPRSDFDAAAARINQLIDGDEALLESRRRGDDFKRRSRLVNVLDGPVAALLGLGVGEYVRVEGRLVGKGENFAVARIEHNDGARCRFVVSDGVSQLALRDVLQVLVNRQLNGGAGGRRPLEPAEGTAASV